MLESDDETFDAINQLLPDISNELKQTIEQELIGTLQEKYQRMIKQLQRQGKQQLQKNLQQLYKQGEQLTNNEIHKLQLELLTAQEQKDQFEKGKLAQAQAKFIQNEFDRVLSHRKIVTIEQNMHEELVEVLSEQCQILFEQRKKEIRVNMQSKEMKEKKERDKEIKLEIMANSGLKELKEEIQALKVGIGAKKSEINVKINKIDKEIKSIKENCKKQGQGNAEGLIVELRQKVKQAENARIQAERNNCELSMSSKEECSEYQMENNLFGDKKKDGFRLMYNDNTNEDVQQLADVSLSSSQSEYEDNHNKQYSGNQQSLVQPPKHLTLTYQGQHQQQEQHQHQQHIIGRQRLVTINVRQMLRQKWEMDDLDRYLNKENRNEEINRETRGKSNFQELYQKHLNRLNQGFTVPMRRLSQKTRQIIVHNMTTTVNSRF